MNSGMKVVGACRTVGIPRSSFYYIIEKNPQAIAELQALTDTTNRELKGCERPFAGPFLVKGRVMMDDDPFPGALVCAVDQDLRFISPLLKQGALQRILVKAAAWEGGDRRRRAL
jgi:hypothetical protein